jgi:quercetin dioxygenase-like cupin family protein
MDESYEPPEVQDATGIVVRKQEVGYFIDWHPAPRRQYIITLAGNVEIGLGDGTVYTLGPGDMMLAEDLTGQGHTTKAVGSETRISVALTLD